jgi:hypothetical protein
MKEQKFDPSFLLDWANFKAEVMELLFQFLLKNVQILYNITTLPNSVIEIVYPRPPPLPRQRPK